MAAHDGPTEDLVLPLGPEVLDQIKSELESNLYINLSDLDYYINSDIDIEFVCISVLENIQKKIRSPTKTIQDHEIGKIIKIINMLYFPSIKNDEIHYNNFRKLNIPTRTSIKIFSLCCKIAKVTNNSTLLVYMLDLLLNYDCIVMDSDYTKSIFEIRDLKIIEELNISDETKISIYRHFHPYLIMSDFMEEPEFLTISPLLFNLMTERIDMRNMNIESYTKNNDYSNTYYIHDIMKNYYQSGICGFTYHKKVKQYILDNIMTMINRGIPWIDNFFNYLKRNLFVHCDLISIFEDMISIYRNEGTLEINIKDTICIYLKNSIHNQDEYLELNQDIVGVLLENGSDLSHLIRVRRGDKVNGYQLIDEINLQWLTDIATNYSQEIRFVVCGNWYQILDNVRCKLVSGPHHSESDSDLDDTEIIFRYINSNDVYYISDEY